MEIINEETTRVPVGDLSRHPRNPRLGDLDAIKESMRENGFYGSVLVQRSTNQIIVGNHRFEAARQLGMEDIPVTYVDVDDQRAERIALADNRANDLATYDYERLTEYLQTLNASDDGLDGTLWTNRDLENLVSTADVDDVVDSMLQSDEFAPPSTSFTVKVDADTVEERDDIVHLLETNGYEANVSTKHS